MFSLAFRLFHRHCALARDYRGKYLDNLGFRSSSFSLSEAVEAWKDISRRLRDTVVRSFVNGAEPPCQLQGHAIVKSILVVWGTKQLVTQATWGMFS